jgi:putative endonuclease
MTRVRQAFGKEAEDRACRFIEAQGYRILERNFRTRFAEVDIIAREGDTLVFLEVKARKSLRRGSPGEAVTPLKQDRLVLAASWYLAGRRLDGIRVRFDVVTVLEEQNDVTLRLIRNAFRPDSGSGR